MSKYYTGNAIYEFISENKIKRFEFVVGSCWQLVYGTNLGEPILLVFAHAFKSELDEKSLKPELKKGFKRLKQLSILSQLPIMFIGFNQNAEEIDSVLISTDLNQFESISLTDLTLVFKSYGLHVKNIQTRKYLNDKISSAYHKWQRDQLGNDISVSDIDLWIIKDEKPNVILELKRSIISLEKWEPYKDDYSNFILLTKLCQRAGVKFFILYNVREKSPVKDIIDKIKLFPVKFENDLVIGEGKIYQISKVIK